MWISARPMLYDNITWGILKQGITLEILAIVLIFSLTPLFHTN